MQEKNWWKSLPALLVIAILAGHVAAAPKDDLPPIDKYTFQWKLFETKDAQLIIQKDADSTLFFISKGFQNISLAGKDAEAVGKALEQTDTEFKKMKANGGDQSEEVKAGGQVLTFEFSAKSGFYVSIKEDRQFSIMSVALTRDEVKGMGAFLLQGTKLIEKVDATIKP